MHSNSMHSNIFDSLIEFLNDLDLCLSDGVIAPRDEVFTMCVQKMNGESEGAKFIAAGECLNFLVTGKYINKVKIGRKVYFQKRL